MSVINGFHAGLRSKIIDKDFHLQIFHKDDLLTNFEEIIDQLKKIKYIKNAVPFFEGKAIIRNNNEKSGLIIRGITNELLTEDQSFKINFPITEGEKILKKNKVILGRQLAQKLRAKIGDIIELYVDREIENADFNFKTKRFIISGIFKSGFIDFDLNLAFILLSDAQKLYNYTSDFFGIIDYKASAIGIKLYNTEDFSKVRNIILQNFPDLRVRTYIDLNGNILYAFDWEKKLMMVVLGIMIMATVLTVMLILTIVVMSKKKEIGILKSFGVSHIIIKKIFIIEGLIISFIGTLVGIILGIIITFHIKELAHFIEFLVNSFINIVKGSFIGDILGIDINISKWEIISEHSMYSRDFPFKILFSDIFILSVLTIFFSLIGSLLPAKKATKISVIEAIRNE